MNDTDVFFPAPRIVQAGGRDVTFRPIPLRKVADFFAAAQEPGPFLFMGEDLMALSQHRAQMVRLICIAADEALDPEWVNDLPISDALALSAAVREVNQSFFDAFAAASISLPMKMAALAGSQTSSSPSPQPELDTATPLN